MMSMARLACDKSILSSALKMRASAWHFRKMRKRRLFKAIEADQRLSVTILCALCRVRYLVRRYY